MKIKTLSNLSLKSSLKQIPQTPAKPLVKLITLICILLSLIWFISLTGCAAETAGSSGGGGNSTPPKPVIPPPTPALLSISGFYTNDVLTEDLQTSSSSMEVRGTCESAAEGLGVEVVLTADSTGNTVTNNTTCQSRDFAVTLNRGSITDLNDGGLNFLQDRNVLITATANLTNDTVMSQPARGRIYAEPHTSAPRRPSEGDISINITYQDIYMRDGECRLSIAFFNEFVSDVISLNFEFNMGGAEWDDLISAGRGNASSPLGQIIPDSPLSFTTTFFNATAIASGYFIIILTVTIPNDSSTYAFRQNQDLRIVTSATYHHCERVN